MGLLSALDFHFSGARQYSVELEYQLQGTGEIYTHFAGDRENSEAARYILKDPPFKLFSSSTPNDPPPQKLSLTFAAPYEERTKTDTAAVNGIFGEEIAKEFAAFLSLITRRRIFVSKQVRRGGLPIEEEAYFYPRSHFQENQRQKEVTSNQVCQLLKNLQSMDREIANSFMLATRLYYTAIEHLYTEPELSYVFLVMSIEAIASKVLKNEDVISIDLKAGNTELMSFLTSKYPNWDKLCDISSAESRKQVVEMFLKKEFFLSRKFRKFITDNIPELFWTESEDDAKPDYSYSLVDSQGPRTVRSELTIPVWEKIEKENLKRVLKVIYDGRSRLVHAGIRLPDTIVSGHFIGIPIEAAVELLAQRPDSSKQELRIPPVLTFERLVSYTLVEFLGRQGRPSEITQTE
jgi:hypothetical protein